MADYDFNLSRDSGRIDKFLAQELEDFSRSKIQTAIDQGQVLVNGKKVKPNYKLQAGDQIQAHLQQEEELVLQAEDKPLSIIYEDADLLIINKPSQLVVHPGPGHWQGTLVNRLLAYTDRLSDLNGKDRPGIVHRLDKDTSGILIVAKHNQAHQHLAQQFKDRAPLRLYQALVHGHPASKQGTIELPLDRDPSHRTRFAVLAGGKEAISHFKCLQNFKDYSLLQVSLETGRTHQIRVHMSHLGHPVLGDSLYGSHQSLDDKGSLALHAYKVGFIHPSKKEWVEYVAPLPHQLQTLIDHLKQ